MSAHTWARNQHCTLYRAALHPPSQGMGFVDLHSHVLYGLDDGAPDEKSALAMLDGLAALGISEQCVTPHQKASQYLPAWELIEATLANLEEVRRPQDPPVRGAAEKRLGEVR